MKPLGDKPEVSAPSVFTVRVSYGGVIVDGIATQEFTIVEYHKIESGGGDAGLYNSFHGKP